MKVLCDLFEDFSTTATKVLSMNFMFLVYSDIFLSSLLLFLAVRNIANCLLDYIHVLWNLVMMIPCKILILMLLLKFALYPFACGCT